MSTDDRIVNIADQARPLAFSDVVGQVFASGVGQRIGSGRISGQGYILSGPKGCGKTSVARIIARSVNCPHRDPDTGDPCNKCSSCQLSLKDSHPYINEINAASARGINEIKEVLKSMNLAVKEGMRVFILDEVHMLTREAFNVLLKPMENPPEHTMFIATTTNPEAIPETIVSRVPVIPINPLSNEDVYRVVENVISTNIAHDKVWEEVTEEDIDHAVLSSQGSARQAITTVSGVVFHGVSAANERQYSKDIVEAIASYDIRKTLDLSYRACSDKTSNPMSLVQAIMDGLLGYLPTSDNPSVLARCIADLSVVAKQLSSSTPALLASSSIASCVPKPPQNPTETPVGNTKGSKKSSGVNTPNKLVISSKTTVDDVLDHLLDNPYCVGKLGVKWHSVLNDYDQSEVTMDGSTVVIRVSRPTEGFKKVVGDLLSSVRVERLQGT